MLKKRIIVTVICSLIIGCLIWFMSPSRPVVRTTKDIKPCSYQVYKSDGSVITLTASPQHPLVFFATFCPTCQKEMADKIDPNAYYIDTLTKESDIQESFKAIQNYIKVYHTDPNGNQYFVSVDKHPQGVPKVPYTISN